MNNISSILSSRKVSVSCAASGDIDCNILAPPPDDQDCIQEVTYFYLLENVGSTPMTITALDRTLDGMTVSFLNLLPTTELGIDESTVVTEMDTINICINQTINTTLSAEAVPPTGSPCFDTDMYSLQTEGLPTTPPPTPPVSCLSNLCFAILSSTDVFSHFAFYSYTRFS